uniref:Uncharacterized protein n=1 Tax=Sander lucioperca TaxID=283035 RepID=A0A8D0CNL7_SANLU
MSGIFAGLLRARRALAPRANGSVLQESMFVLTVLAVAVLGPSGWILAHLDHYKTRG